MKKAFSFLLIFCMIFSAISFVSLPAHANESDNADGSAQEREEWLQYLADNPDCMADECDILTTINRVTLIDNCELSQEDDVQALAATNEINRYTVLVLDRSGSMAGTPMSAMKTASSKFCEAVIQAEGNNYVAVVAYDSSVYTLCGFTNDITTLKNVISSLSTNSATNTNGGLVRADDLLNAIPDEPNTVKNVLLLSDGLPNEGNYSSEGRYSYADYYYYQYANATYNTAKAMHNKGYYIYTLGFFHSLSGSELNFGRRFMNDLQNAGYYDVVNPDDLEFVFGEIAGDITKISGTFKYGSSFIKGTNGKKYDWSATFYYNDEYFFKSSYAEKQADGFYKYNDSLATMSMCLELSAWASDDYYDPKPYSEKSANAKALLETIGFSNFEASEGFKVQPTRDSIGAVVANKKLKVNGQEYTLIALAIRGGGYGAEWASNFTLGTTGQHQGFAKAKDDVLEFLRDYISDYDITGNIKLWLVGYSRAAAAANLLAGALDNGAYLGNCSLEREDLYAYCFETPAGTLDSYAKGSNKDIYNNIINIINPNDFVTKVAPAANKFNFTRYGIDVVLPTGSDKTNYNDFEEKMLEQFNELEAVKSTDTEYTIGDFKMKKWSMAVDWFLFTPIRVYPVIVDDTKNQISQNVFLNEFVTKLAVEQLKNRQNYVKEFEDDIEEAMAILLGADNEQWGNFVTIFKDKLVSNVPKLIASTTFIGGLFFGNTISLIEDYAVQSLGEAGISNYDKRQINSMAISLASLILKFAVSHPNLTTTLICNLNGIVSAHFPELCLAWMQSRDRNYTDNAFWEGTTGSYRIVRINCPIDVEVYDDSDNLVATIIADEPQYIEGSSIVSSINEDGEKIVYIPADAGYNVKMKATDDGLMSYSINEYCFEAGDITRIINYYDITINESDVFTCYLPAFTVGDIENGTLNGSSLTYVLYDGDNNPIEPSEDLTGGEATTYYMVSVTPSNDQYGMVSGQGVRQTGNYALVSATPFEECEFMGWYIGDVKVSSELEYRFRVENDVDLIANFVSNGTKHLLTITTETGGKIVAGVDGEYETGTVINIAATPDSGYSFSGWTTSNGGTFGNTNNASTTFTMPENDTTVTAHFTYIGTGDNGGYIYIPVHAGTPTVPPETSQPTTTTAPTPDQSSAENTEPETSEPENSSSPDVVTENNGNLFSNTEIDDTQDNIQSPDDTVEKPNPATGKVKGVIYQIGFIFAGIVLTAYWIAFTRRKKETSN